MGPERGALPIDIRSAGASQMDLRDRETLVDRLTFQRLFIPYALLSINYFSKAWLMDEGCDPRRKW
jgi:hypothetical protein